MPARRGGAGGGRRTPTGGSRPGSGCPCWACPWRSRTTPTSPGLPTAFGCPGDVPPATADAEAVRRLRAAGAVIVGKTNACELGQWPFTEGPAFGATRNPWNPAHTPGGSSGGSAAAVAAGLVPGRPRFGRRRLHPHPRGLDATWSASSRSAAAISLQPTRESFNGLTVFGPLARTVADAALLLDVAAGIAPAATRTGRRRSTASAAAGREPGRLRIALSAAAAVHRHAARRCTPRYGRAVIALAETWPGSATTSRRPTPTTGWSGSASCRAPRRAYAECRRPAPRPALLDPRTRGAVRTGRRLGGPALRLARAPRGAPAAPRRRLLHRLTTSCSPRPPPPRRRASALSTGWARWPPTRA